MPITITLLGQVPHESQSLTSKITTRIPKQSNCKGTWLFTGIRHRNTMMSAKLQGLIQILMQSHHYQNSKNCDSRSSGFHKLKQKQQQQFIKVDQDWSLMKSLINIHWIKFCHYQRESLGKLRLLRTAHIPS